MRELEVRSYYLDRGDIPNSKLETTLDRVNQRDGTDMWTIRKGGFCLNKKGEWEFEPLPSSRTAAWLERCRYPSAEVALIYWGIYEEKNP